MAFSISRLTSLSSEDFRLIASSSRSFARSISFFSLFFRSISSLSFVSWSRVSANFISTSSILVRATDNVLFSSLISASMLPFRTSSSVSCVVNCSILFFVLSISTNALLLCSSTLFISCWENSIACLFRAMSPLIDSISRFIPICSSSPFWAICSFKTRNFPSNFVISPLISVSS